MQPLWRYHHTQIALPWIALAGALAIAMLFTPIRSASITFSVLLLAVWLMLTKLTVFIDDTRLTIKFGPGIVRKSFLLSEMTSCAAVRNKWYCGWGIHRTSNGWLYNIYGLDAVEITFSSGKKVRIGTDDPRGLAAALSAVIGHKAGT